MDIFPLFVEETNRQENMDILERAPSTEFGSCDSPEDDLKGCNNNQSTSPAIEQTINGSQGNLNSSSSLTEREEIIVPVRSRPRLLLKHGTKRKKKRHYWSKCNWYTSPIAKFARDETVWSTSEGTPYSSEYSYRHLSKESLIGGDPRDSMKQIVFVHALGLVTHDESNVFTHKVTHRKKRKRAATLDKCYFTPRKPRKIHVKVKKDEGPPCLTAEVRDEGNRQELLQCCSCKKDGTNILCDSCSSSFHIACLRFAGSRAPDPKFIPFCPMCVSSRHPPKLHPFNDKQTIMTTENHQEVTNNKIEFEREMPKLSLQKKLEPEINATASDITGTSLFKVAVFPQRSSASNTGLKFYHNPGYPKRFNPPKNWPNENFRRLRFAPVSSKPSTVTSSSEEQLLIENPKITSTESLRTLVPSNDCVVASVEKSTDIADCISNGTHARELYSTARINEITYLRRPRLVPKQTLTGKLSDTLLSESARVMSSLSDPSESRGSLRQNQVFVEQQSTVMRTFKNPNETHGFTDEKIPPKRPKDSDRKTESKGKVKKKDNSFSARLTKIDSEKSDSESSMNNSKDVLLGKYEDMKTASSSLETLRKEAAWQLAVQKTIWSEFNKNIKSSIAMETSLKNLKTSLKASIALTDQTEETITPLINWNS